MTTEALKTGNAITLSRIGMTFERDGRRTVAFEDVSLEVPHGRFVVLIGPSGCGKSTVLRCIADLLMPTSGEVRVFGAAPGIARERRRVSFVFQDATLLAWRTVAQNISFPFEVGRWRRLGRTGRSPRELIDLVGLAGREQALPHELSGGQRQRVSIARALATQPDILLLDEPFSALDEITRDRMNEELLRIWRETATTVVFVTHSLAEAAFLGQTIVVMGAHPGRIEAVVELDEHKPQNLIDRTSVAFFEITSRLRAILEKAHA
jgi:NitT/TauT family transport system ATP-binding protein